MKVCKNREVVLRGIRNRRDGLWDMPLIQPLKEDNYIKPATHAALHGITKKNRSYNNPNYVNNYIKTSPSEQEPFHHEIPQHLQSIEPLIKSNIDDATIKKFTKNDHKLNVIIRKKQTKRELAKYLHASCLSPPITTFVKSIKTNTF